MWDALPNRLRFFQIVFLADFNQVSRIYFMLEQRGALLGFNLQGGGDVLPTGKALLLQIFVEGFLLSYRRNYGIRLVVFIAHADQETLIQHGTQPLIRSGFGLAI